MIKTIIPSPLTEFIADHTHRQPSNALGLRIINTNHVVTIVAGTNTNRYRVQSNDPLSMTLVIEQMVSRLRSRSPGNVVTSIGQNHLQLVQSQIESHFASRQRVKTISVGRKKTFCFSNKVIERERKFDSPMYIAPLGMVWHLIPHQLGIKFQSGKLH